MLTYFESVTSNFEDVSTSAVDADRGFRLAVISFLTISAPMKSA